MIGFTIYEMMCMGCEFEIFPIHIILDHHCEETLDID